MCGRLKIHPVMIDNNSVGVIKNSVLVGNSSVYWDFSQSSKLQKRGVLFDPLPLQEIKIRCIYWWWVEVKTPPKRTLQYITGFGLN